MDMFSIISGTCSVLSLLVSLFTAGKVVKISQTFNCCNRDDHSRVKSNISDTTINGSFIGRDKR